jgi:hypothetical protein
MGRIAFCTPLAAQTSLRDGRPATCVSLQGQQDWEGRSHGNNALSRQGHRPLLSGDWVAHGAARQGAAGLLLVVSHNVWVAGWPVIVTLLSWLVLIKAIAYLLLPFSAMAGVVKAFNRPAWFTAGGAITAGFGVFLAAKGFQIF